MTSLKNAVRVFASSEDGAALAEYGLLVALIAAICVTVISTLGTTISSAFEVLNSNM